jgi:hypothetical protein
LAHGWHAAFLRGGEERHRLQAEGDRDLLAGLGFLKQPSRAQAKFFAGNEFHGPL